MWSQSHLLRQFSSYKLAYIYQEISHAPRTNIVTKMLPQTDNVLTWTSQLKEDINGYVGENLLGCFLISYAFERCLYAVCCFLYNFNQFISFMTFFTFSKNLKKNRTIWEQINKSRVPKKNWHVTDEWIEIVQYLVILFFIVLEWYWWFDIHLRHVFFFLHNVAEPYGCV